MTKFEDVIYGEEGISLSEANDIIWDSKLNCLPILDKNQCLRYLVFRKDYDSATVQMRKLMVDFPRGYFVNDALRLLVLVDQAAGDEPGADEHAA